MSKWLLTICVGMLLSGAAYAADAPAPKPGDKPGEKVADKPAVKPVNPKSLRLDALLQKVQADPGGTKEPEVRELLDLAKELGRPYSASLAIRGYLSHNFQPSPELLLATAEAAYRAGDYTYAVTRYKAYLGLAKPSPQAAQACATLLTILVDFLGAEDDAYQFMSKDGLKFRSDPATRRFDSWFLAKARAQSDLVNLAKGLSLALADQMPLEQERLYYWSHLDFLMGEITKAPQAHFPSLPFCQKILPLIREDKQRSARYGYFVASLAFHAGSAGKDDEALGRDFGLLVQAAQAYLDAFPTAKTLKDIVEVMGGGVGRFDGNTWKQLQPAKQKFFAAAFPKLNAADKEAIMSWGNGGMAPVIATPEQWAELALKDAPFFAACKATRFIPFSTQLATRDDYRKLAAACAGVASEDAAVICAIAASDDMNAAVDHLMKNASWFLGADRYNQIINGRLWPAYSKLAEVEKKKLPDNALDLAWLRFGTEYLAKSPIAIYDAEAVRSFLRAVWKVSGKDSNDKSQVARHLEMLQWAPFENVPNRKADRAEMFNTTANEQKQWTEFLRSEAKKPDKDRNPAVTPELLAQIEPVEAAYNKARGACDPTKAPTELCKAMAQVVLADRDQKENERLAAEKLAYAQVKDYETAKTPYGRDAFWRIIQSTQQRAFSNLPLQLEMLDDQLSRFTGEPVGEPLDRLLNAIFGNRQDWQRRNSQGKNKDQLLQVSAVLGKAVSRLADAGKFSPYLFDWFRDTRLGQNWNGGEAGQDVMAKIIDKRLFGPANYRPHETNFSATTGYQRMVRHEFPGLNAKYPVETWFDDMFVEEATQKKFMDWAYWEFGQDSKKKVASLAARLLAEDRLPLGADDAEGTYSLKGLVRWMGVALKADKALREALLAKADAAYGKGRFDVYAMGFGQFEVDPPPAPAAGAAPAPAPAPGTPPAAPAGMKPEERKAFFAKLATFLDRSAKAPTRVGFPPLPQLKDLTAKDLTDQELTVLVRMFTDASSPYWAKDYQFDTIIKVVHAAMLARNRQADLFPLIGHFWKAAQDIRDGNFHKDLVAMVDDLRKAQEPDLALAYSTVALATQKGDLSADNRSALSGVRAWALSEMGGIIPVAKGHPLRALYEAQLAYLTGKGQTAWELYVANRARLPKSFKEFDPQFCIWVIDKNTEFRDFDDAELLGKEMGAWFDEVTDRFEPEVRARLQLSYANLALARDDRPRARALYERIVAAKEFADTRARLDAELKIADVDTADGSFDKAIERLDLLARRKNPYLQTEAAYHMALVKFAQEEFTEAKDHLDRLFALNPDHADGRILEGKVNLKLKKLEQPTDIDLGERIGRKFIVPGRPLQVTLVDRNLSVVRKATEIEVRAWTDSGDEELFVLSPFGDSKTKFKGQIPTELGAPKKNDHILQVTGNDQIHYAFSDRFAKAQMVEQNMPYTLSVATDPELYVSSGAILNKEQRESKALEEMIRRRMNPETADKKTVPLSTLRADTQIKPGNKINVRVIDATRSITPGKNAVAVKMITASGDTIEAFPLAETAPYSGVFEAAVPTEPAQATAYASDSQEGSEANFAISAKDYPAWVGLPKPTRSRPKTFSIDLNDNASLGKMKITAKEPARKLKSFLVQTSFNAQDFTTVGAWPTKFVPWTGQATLDVARFVNDEEDEARRTQVTAPKTAREFLNYFEQGVIRQGQKQVSLPIKTLAADWDWNVAGKGQQLDLDNNKDSHKYYVAHLKAAFYQPRRQIRTFTLQPKGDKPAAKYPVSFVLAVDGESTAKRRTQKEGDFALEIKPTLAKGVHTVEVFVFAHQHGNPSFEVTCDTNNPPYVIPCPEEMFDAAKHPEIAQGLAKPVAEVTADKDATAFDVQFPPASRARVVRLLLTDFESDAPAINKIQFTDGDGKEVLPTKNDFMALRKNQVLEIVPGDRITVTYQNPKVLTRGKETQEAFLTATYTNAKVSACFVNYTMQEGGERKADYVAMRRFKPGDKINVFINDPDCDVTDKPDTVKFTVKAGDGKPVELDALETEEHSGIFLGTVFPVQGEPKRPSELSVKDGDDVVLSYLDKDNTDPGIPWNRTFAVEQVWFEPPEVRIYEVTSLTLEEADKLAGRKGPAKPVAQARTTLKIGRSGNPDEAAMPEEFVVPRRTLLALRPEKSQAEKPANFVVGGPLLVEVMFPYIAKSIDSTCSIYVQTAAARKKFGKPIPETGFDVNVPGTLKISRIPGDDKNVDVAPGYREVIVRGNPYALTALDDGRFTFSVPVRLGAVPDKTLIGFEDAQKAAAAAGGGAEEKAEPPALSISGQDQIYVGMTFKDQAGKDQWVVRKAALSGDLFFDITDRRYHEKVEGAYVGESVYFRVIDPTRDATDQKDIVKVDLTTQSGKTKQIDLLETFSHSGVFKGLVRVVHAEDKASVDELGTVPAVYGDVLTAKYADPAGGKTAELAVAIYKGADGKVVPFTKRFKDPAIAVETQFMIAEAYFELAKRHRQLNQDATARAEIAQGQKLLEEAIRDYPNTAARAQAEYLLADLSLEFGNDAANAESKKKHYMDAIARYSDIVATYGDSEYAPKAQYHKALAYERMEMLDEACEEYVKLSYRYPDNPLVAETIARLGNYFMNKGRTIRAAADKETDPVQREKTRLQAADMFKTAAQVLSRLSIRFPNHLLAGKTLLMAAQCYMQAEDYPNAVKGYTQVFQSPNMDKDLVAEAMYWCGHSYMETNDLVKAYQMFKKLTWDYPASKWAKFARGRLADEKLANMEEKQAQ